MKIARSITLLVATAWGLCSHAVVGQEIRVTAEKGIVTVSVAAQKPYTLTVAGQPKTPLLSVTCQQKGKKIAHVITFSPGGILTEQEYSTFGNSASLELDVTLGEHKQSTTWVSHGNLQSFDYYGKTEPERIQFVQALLSVPSVSIAFTPFLTGTPTASTFDLSGLRAEIVKHPECAMQ